MTEEVLEQKIENLTEYIQSLNVSMKVEDETYKSILAKIAHRLDELETEENLDILEIKDRIKFLTAQIDDNDNSESIGHLKRAVDELKSNQDKSFADIQENIEASQNFQDESLQRLSEVIEKLEQLQVQNNDKFNSTIDEIRNDLNEVKEKAQNSQNLSNELKESIYSAIDSIDNKFDEIISSQSHSFDDYKDLIINNISDIKGQLWDTENNIKNAIREQVEDYANSIDVQNRLDYLVQTMSVVNKDTTDIVGELENIKYTTQETNETSSAVKDYLDATKDDLKNNLRNLQEQFVLQMLQVFDNISFASETEEIIDFVDESSYAIKAELETLKQELTKFSNDNPAFFNKHFNNLCDLVTKQTSNEFNLLKDVASEIKKITANSENSDEYTYSLPDIENDLAKIRLILKELQTEKVAKDEKDLDITERFEILNEDISSISKRTNKLILTAEETNQKFKGYLDEFKGIMNHFSIKNRQTYIEQKVDSAIRLITSNAKSSQILNEAFMYFAQWVDETSETMEINKQTLNKAEENIEMISQRLSNVEEELKAMNERYQAKIDENKELQMTVEKQNKLIVKLEQKMDKYGTVEAKIDDETKSVIEYIASQTGITAENTEGNKELSDKLDFLEHKITSLSKNIQKIISYIDEE